MQINQTRETNYKHKIRFNLMKDIVTVTGKASRKISIITLNISTFAKVLSSKQIDNSKAGASLVVSGFETSGVGNRSTGFELPNSWLSI